MPRGISLHVGLNAVDPSRYEGWDGALNACEADARAMQAIAADAGFQTTMLLTEQATAQAVLDALSSAAQALEPGDIMLFTNASHGGQVWDVGGDEADARDETIVMYDREVLDDELYGVWAQFRPGVRVLFFSDSCHSGTVARLYMGTPGIQELHRSLGLGDAKPRVMPREVQEAVNNAQSGLFRQIQAAHPAGDRARVGATVLQFGGCQDNQVSMDGPHNGLFTSKVMVAWNSGAFAGDYARFYKKVRRLMPATQSPSYFRAGAPMPEFEAQRPFTI